MNASSCAQQVYSAAYLNSFNPGNLCSNIQGAMGFSTSGHYGYSLLVPPSTNFNIVNNTTGIVPPSSNCANYTMTVTLCSANPELTMTKANGLQTISANSIGQAVVQVPVVFHNSGNFPGSVDTNTVTEDVNITVADGQPAAVQQEFGKAGAIVQPGQTMTQTIPLAFEGSQFQCTSRLFTISSTLEATPNVYDCTGYNPPSAQVVTGSLLPEDNFMEDTFAFQSAPGAHITVTVDTVSTATAFDIEACVSATPQGTCLPGFSGDDNFTCTFPPPAFNCPRFGGLLPADTDGDNIYYVRVNSGSGASNFAGLTGDFRATVLVTSGPTGMCPVVQVQDNGANSFLALANAFPSSPNWTPGSKITANVTPIMIRVPPSSPTAPGCGPVFLPLAVK